MNKIIEWRHWGFLFEFWITTRLYDFIQTRIRKRVLGCPFPDRPNILTMYHDQRRWRIVKKFMSSNPAGEILESDKPDGPYTVCKEVEE